MLDGSVVAWHSGFFLPPSCFACFLRFGSVRFESTLRFGRLREEEGFRNVRADRAVVTQKTWQKKMRPTV